MDDHHKRQAHRTDDPVREDQTKKQKVTLAVAASNSSEHSHPSSTVPSATSVAPEVSSHDASDNHQNHPIHSTIQRVSISDLLHRYRSSAGQLPTPVGLSTTVAFREGHCAVVYDRHTAAIVIFSDASDNVVPLAGRCILSNSPVEVYLWPSDLLPSHHYSVVAATTASAIAASDMPTFADEAEEDADTASAASGAFQPLPQVLRAKVSKQLIAFSSVVDLAAPYVVVVGGYHVRSLQSSQALPFTSVAVLATLPDQSCVYFRGTVCEPATPIPKGGVSLVLQDEAGQKIAMAAWNRDDTQRLTGALKGDLVSIHRVFVVLFQTRPQLSLPYPVHNKPGYYLTFNENSRSLFERHGVEPGHLEVEARGSSRGATTGASISSSSSSSSYSSSSAPLSSTTTTSDLRTPTAHRA